MSTQTIVQHECGIKLPALTRDDLAIAIHDDECMLGRLHSARERVAFCAGFWSRVDDQDSER